MSESLTIHENDGRTPVLIDGLDVIAALGPFANRAWATRLARVPVLEDLIRRAQCVDCGLPADVLNEDRDPVCASCLDRADAEAELQAEMRRQDDIQDRLMRDDRTYNDDDE